MMPSKMLAAAVGCVCLGLLTSVGFSQARRTAPAASPFAAPAPVNVVPTSPVPVINELALAPVEVDLTLMTMSLRPPPRSVFRPPPRLPFPPIGPLP